jgi:hypothetical protein
LRAFAFWKDAVPLFSVPLAVAAFFHSRAADRAKAEREKREEVRASIEKLLEFRALLEEKAAAAVDEQQFVALSARLNTRKLIYLQSAEELAVGLPHVTPAEWTVLGYEHMEDSNFAHAAKIFDRAVEAAKSDAAAVVTRVTAMRSLAGAFMMQGGTKLLEGRDKYREAIALISGQKDPYSGYTVAITYRYWASFEWRLDHLGEAVARLADAGAVLATLPDGFGLRQSEARQCCRMLADLAETFRKQGDRTASRDALNRSEMLLGDWPDDATRQLRGLIALCRARLAASEGDVSASQTQARAAHRFYLALPQNKARDWALSEALALSGPADPIPTATPPGQVMETTTLPT